MAPCIRRTLLAAAIVALALARPAAGPNDRWPQFRGPSAGVAENDPALARSLERHEQHRSGPPTCRAWAGARPSSGAITCSSRSVINTGAGRSAQARAVLRRRTAGVHGAAPVDGLRRRLRDRQGAVVEGSAQRRAAAAEAPQEQLRVGDAGHRRRARLLLLRQRRPVRVRHEGHAGLVETARPVQDAQRVGHGRIARAPPRSRSTSSTTTTSSRSWRRTTSGPARRSGA